MGAGNAAFASAVAAVENGSKVLMLEKTSEDHMGGNSALTIHMRFAYNSSNDLIPPIKFPEEKDKLSEFEKMNQFKDSVNLLYRNRLFMIY